MAKKAEVVEETTEVKAPKKSRAKKTAKVEAVTDTKAKVDLSKVTEAVKALEEANPENMDFIEMFGVLVDDIADLYKVKDYSAFMAQKKDAKKTFKTLYRKLNALTFKTR